MGDTETAIATIPEPEDAGKYLQMFESARKMLVEARRVDEVLQVRDQAEVLRLYAHKARMSLHMLNDIAEIKLRAERKLGEMLRERESAQGRRTDLSTSLDDQMKFAQAPTLAALGISGFQSHRWQKIADMPKEFFEHHIEATKAAEAELTTASVFRAIGRMEKAQMQEKAEELGAEPIPTPDGPFRCIVIDPPWAMARIAREIRPQDPATLDYPTMSIEQLEQLPVDQLSDPSGSHLYLWVTQKYLPIGLELLEIWGFKYQCIMTWVKPTGMTPYSWMYNTEHVLFARRGNLDLLRYGLKLSFDAPRTRHSEKPDVFYERVVATSPGPRLEMFARCEREGFVPWGTR